MDINKLRQIAPQINAELEAVFLKYGLKKHTCKVVTDEGTGIVKYNLVLHDLNMTDPKSGNQTTPEVLLWNQQAAIYGLPVEALNKSFMMNHKMYTIMGLRSGRSQKNVIVRGDDLKRYRVEAATVKRCLTY